MHRPSPVAVVLVIVGLALTIALTAWWWRGDDSGGERDRAGAQAHPARASRASAPTHASEPESAPPSPSPQAAPTTEAKPEVSPGRPSADTERARLRAAILAKHRARPPSPTPPEAPPPAGQLRKRVEGHDALFAELQADFMPLADECVEQAQARDEALGGTLAVGIELLVDDELGTIVEGVEFPSDQNEIADPELQSCVRESLLSMVLPPDAETGAAAVMLTMPIAQDAL